jgi:hypothetical protein
MKTIVPEPNGSSGEHAGTCPADSEQTFLIRMAPWEQHPVRDASQAPHRQIARRAQLLQIQTNRYEISNASNGPGTRNAPWEQHPVRDGLQNPHVQIARRAQLLQIHTDKKNKHPGGGAKGQAESNQTPKKQPAEPKRCGLMREWLAPPFAMKLAVTDF